MLPRKNFENLHAVMAILVLFVQFSGKFCLIFLALLLSTSPNMMHFVRTFSIMRGEGKRLIAIEGIGDYEKIVYIENIFEGGWWEDAYLSSYPPGSTSGHKLQKPSKESSIFQSLGAISFVLFF